MKRLLLTLLLSGSLLQASFADKIYGKTKSDHERVVEAISNSDVNTVLSLVKFNNEHLEEYYELSQCSFGTAPKVGWTTQALGITKILLAAALFYKTGDHFKTEYQQFNSFMSFINRYKSIHHVLMDTAILSQLAFTYMAVSSGINNINPKSSYKKQLLINLYLQNLLRK